MRALVSLSLLLSTRCLTGVSVEELATGTRVLALGGCLRYLLELEAITTP